MHTERGLHASRQWMPNLPRPVMPGVLSVREVPRPDFSTMDAMATLAENDANSPCWRDDSFVALLHEARRWDERAYLKLEAAFFALCETRKTDGRTRNKIDCIAARIFSYTMLTFSCHFDPNDGYSIQNLTEDDIYSWRERIQLVFEGFFAGELPNRDTLRPQSPSALGSTGDSAPRQ